MTLPPPPPAPRSPGRTLRIVLVVSLALNLLVVGLFAGVVLSRGGPGGPRSFELGLGPLVEALEPADRRAVAEGLRGRPGLRDLHPRSRAALMDDLAGALAADPFDREAVERVLATQADRMAAGQALARAAFLDRVEAMSPEARAAYADRLRRGTGRGGESPRP